MKAISAKCGHVKRRLKRNERLTGKVLEFALSVIGELEGSSDFEKFLRGMAGKLKAGQQLDKYEFHIMVDVLLLHERLAGPPVNSRTARTEIIDEVPTLVLNDGE